jgi:hypothetical protein
LIFSSEIRMVARYISVIVTIIVQGFYRRTPKVYRTGSTIKCPYSRNALKIDKWPKC